MATEELRARDSDRVEACGVFDAALADGQLTGPEHTARTSAATRAVSIAELDELVADLQPQADQGGSPDRRAGSWNWRIPAAVVAAAVAIGAGAGALSRLDADLPALPASQERSAGPNLTAMAGITHFIEAYRAEFGDTIADHVTFFDDHVSFERFDPATRQLISYTYREGEFDSWQSRGDRKPDKPTFDMAEIDIPLIAGLLAGAKQTVHAEGGTMEHIDLELRRDGPGPARPVVGFVLSHPTKSGYGRLTVGFDGEVIEVGKAE
ncbi:DUF1707 domain-containing protein [Nocardia sp. NPDC059180]|uniref:DUF1707 SHOCT-like domain-containing protein n=1 Tax=Nocardia sp. NPDC059180 TaxID=3346761 RepID=UPI0036BE8461